MDTKAGRPDEGVAFCSYCDWHYRYAIGSQEQLPAAQKAAEHVRSCQSNPIVQQRDLLLLALKALRAEVSVGTGDDGFEELKQGIGHLAVVVADAAIAKAEGR
jgi:hypothetical protein